ncbi:MAG TPA: DUF3379 family protein [Steroidobacteraceae bacterium]|jgi:hypothetical protein
MSCEEIRELIGADPNEVSAQLQAHLDSCPSCRAWLADMQRLDERIRHALQIDPQKLRIAGSPRAAPVLDLALAKRRRPRLRALSIASSLAAGLLVAFTLWLSRPNASLASEIVTHVEGEPASWGRTQPVASEQLAEVLRKSGVRLGPGMGSVVYASSCLFRGHLVPHLVVSTASGPVTVMILAHERVGRHETFSEDGYSGLLVPARSGSVAILSRAPMALEPPAAEVLRALDAANNAPPAGMH